ncbi:deoxyguanosinetriphosphate triphosphohydrolase family protein [Paeniglutamicibacter terrestris]|uniref:DNTP triphosphohydrolase n=1 Tax=Paeniglutamicibacter terrestris TaxID=2723403 RepID=A0ABX1G503_9MICC|nr:dNTP triphosphohydrolase [Paeniglutamicibacter terrestris]ASN41110.1 phosphodiesterase [Arthrobacter sp. 7749]NKG21348.1 dNTP triphosphohydrolase [Paeniglutamicibacter terrestris]
MDYRNTTHQSGGRERSIDEDSRPGEDEFRVDIERIRFSPYFSRLSAVTQVIPQAGAGTVVHNRLTHTLKVSAVARSIAIGLRTADEPTRALVAELGGCDPVVVQAAAAAHDLGHPPFGHLGEQELDRAARNILGLPDGFEGNAQSFRILTALDSCDASPRGLNLTRAVRAAVLKYPWTRNAWRTLAPRPPELLPRGVGIGGGSPALKFSAYDIESAEMADVLSVFPQIAEHQQTLECSVMDIADDIAYAVHDLDDFYRAGVLQYSLVSTELRRWLDAASELAALDARDLDRRLPGHELERAWRRVAAKDPWISDAQAFRASVQRVDNDLVEGLLSLPYDGGLDADRTVTAFTRRWIDRLQGSIAVEKNPQIRSGHVRLADEAWHDVVVLKFVHERFVLERSDLALYQRGQTRIIKSLAEGLSAWLDDPQDSARAPRRLLDSVEAATAEYQQLFIQSPNSIPNASGSEIRRLGRSRAIVDYIASFTDAQAVSVNALLTGSSESIWEVGRGL